MNEFIEYKLHPLYTTSCFSCDSCNRECSLFFSTNKNFLTGYKGFYKNTNIEVSFLYKTDLQTFYWREPICNVCCKHWINRYKNFINKKILNSVLLIQKWYLQYHYSPPTNKLKNGGKGYITSKKNFERKIIQ